jgi:CubicO group peptidase (beta-lactamase class C family)
MHHFKIIFLLILFFLPVSLWSQLLPLADPDELGMDGKVLQRVDTLIGNAIDDGQTPGAVFLVTRKGKVVYRKAYGYAQLIPEKKAMTVETVFDLASMTKPMSTATSIMILIDRGQIRLLDPVASFIPGFQSWVDPESGEKTTIRLWHLLTHSSGLPPYAPVKELEEKYGAPNPDSLMSYISAVKRNSEPGTKFKYSCLNFITLQKVVEKVTGGSLDVFARKNIFQPLKMANTGYKPGVACAVTEVIDGKPLDGVVHDPLARVMMDCVSGNAGLFSTADDIAVFAQMMLNGGVFNGARILSPLAVKTMTTVPRQVFSLGRALGWDVDSAYSSNGGDLFPYGSYGHTGYTGTSIWIDPESQTSVILLTNRVHPDDKSSVVRLRSLVANVVAASIVDLN